MANKSKIFKMPVPVKILGRTSSITNSFVNGVIPVIEPTEEEVSKALSVLGMTEDTVCCAYCGDPHTEWDHLHPLIEDKRPTGYISEIHNLVPSCGKCNQSKGNKEWKEWMISSAELSPKTREIKDIDLRIKKLEEYEKKFHPVRIDNFEEIVGEEKWRQHWKNCDDLHAIMKEYQKLSDEIKGILEVRMSKNVTKHVSTNHAVKTHTEKQQMHGNYIISGGVCDANRMRAKEVLRSLNSLRCAGRLPEIVKTTTRTSFDNYLSGRPAVNNGHSTYMRSIEVPEFNELLRKHGLPQDIYQCNNMFKLVDVLAELVNTPRTAEAVCALEYGNNACRPALCYLIIYLLSNMGIKI